MGFLGLALVGAFAAALLWRFGVPRSLWSMAGAALMLGATGYALQGHPLLGGAARSADAMPIEVEPGLVELRDDMFGRYTADGAYMIAADALTRSGDPGAAAQAVLGGIARTRNSALLWTGLGDALAEHDGRQVSPSALFAYQHAMRLGPKHPGPPFFAGLAYVRAGKLADALPYWRRALALTPAGASYRPLVAQRVRLLELYLAQTGQLQR